MNIDFLPPEILSKIFSHFSFKELLVLERVSYLWKDIIYNASLWRKLEVNYIFHKDDFESFTSQLTDHRSLVRNLNITGLKKIKKLTSILKNCCQLETLKLEHCKMETGSLKHIELLSNLTIFSMKNCYLSPHTKFLDRGKINFSLLKNLKRVELDNFVLSDENFYSILLCRKITHFDISNIRYISQHNIVTFLIQNKDILKSLYLRTGESYDDKLFYYIVECQQLKDINLMECENFSDQGLLQLSKLKLTHLTLYHSSKFSEKALLTAFTHSNWSDIEYIHLFNIRNTTARFVYQVEETCLKLKKFTIDSFDRINRSLPEDEAIQTF